MKKTITITLQEKDGIGDLSVDAPGFTVHEAIGALEQAKLNLLKIQIEMAHKILSQRYFDESQNQDETTR